MCNGLDGMDYFIKFLFWFVFGVVLLKIIYVML